MAFFHCRLIAPRASFAFDMTENERAVMTEHVAYHSGLAEKGIALLFGPVLDPKGPWGLGIFETDDEATLQKLLAEDPAIKSGLGFSYEVLPMMQAVLGCRLTN